jgi:FkbM family methyltransferase
MHMTIPSSTDLTLAQIIAEVGAQPMLRKSILEALRQGEREAADPAAFRDQIRWPMISALLQKAEYHRVVLRNGLVFDVGPFSRIEQALLLSEDELPDHVWEPQTTKLLITLAAGTANVIVGGAYIGDQVLLLAKAMTDGANPGVIHAFEPMAAVFRRFVDHLELNHIRNVQAHQLCLWGRSGIELNVQGPAALAASFVGDQGPGQASEMAQSITIDDYASSRQLSTVGLIMLDTEGGEYQALVGATGFLSRAFPEAPHVIFEIHRSYVDWSIGLENTPIVSLLTSRGYSVFAIRDCHDNYNMAGRPIEIIPLNCIYLGGPAHGFNLLATKDPCLVQRLNLQVVEGVSPKLLVHKDPKLHHPLGGF